MGILPERFLTQTLIKLKAKALNIRTQQPLDFFESYVTTSFGKIPLKSFV